MGKFKILLCLGVGVAFNACEQPNTVTQSESSNSIFGVWENYVVTPQNVMGSNMQLSTYYRLSIDDSIAGSETMIQDTIFVNSQGLKVEFHLNTVSNFRYSLNASRDTVSRFVTEINSHLVNKWGDKVIDTLIHKKFSDASTEIKNVQTFKRIGDSLILNGLPYNKVR